MIIYVDMDDTICQYTAEYENYKLKYPAVEWPQSKQYFFLDLLPIEGAVDAVNELRERNEVYILTAPSYYNPRSYMEKRIWIESYFDLDFCKNLIICGNKGLVKGDYMVEDHTFGRGQENFEGELLHFGSKMFPDWKHVLQYVRGRL